MLIYKNLLLKDKSLAFGFITIPEVQEIIFAEHKHLAL
jgi:hypothetical protein